MGYPESNIVKYVTRHPYKGKSLQDLKKARWYLDQLIKEVENVNHEIAQELIARAIFGEKRNGEMILRPGFQINSGDRVLVVDDVLTTGGSVSKLIDLTQEQKGEVVAAAFLVDRSSTPIDFGIPQFCLAKIDAPTYHPKDCPMDKAGIPIVEP